jgi:hypothetical protein
MGRTWGFGYMNWREYITRFSSDVEFNPPATESEIAASEARLNVSFPEKLRELLLQSNGVLDRYKTPFIWSADEIAKRNIEMRSYPGFEELYMPFDHLLFFGMPEMGTYFLSQSLLEKFVILSYSNGSTKATAESRSPGTLKHSWIGGFPQ